MMSYKNKEILGSDIKVAVVHLLGSAGDGGKIYPLNCGTYNLDGQSVNVYILGVYEPLQSFDGVCVAALYADEKPTALIAAKEGEYYTKEQISALVAFDNPSFDDIATVAPEAHSQLESVETKGGYTLYADGGSRGNPGPSASGFVIYNPDGLIVVESGEYLGVTTNNQAEYQALKFGLDEAQKRGIREIDVFLDSMLVVNQMNGTFKVKNRDLWPIYESVKELVKNFKQVSFTHVPRELNKHADGLVNQTLDARKTTL